MMAGLVLSGLTGCETLPTPPPVAAAAAASQEVTTLKSGDVLKVSFPGVPSMDTTQPIRPDGKLSLPMVEDIVAAGKNLESLSKELRELYAPKLVSKEVTVSLVCLTNFGKLIQ